jgi:hypothetical protein
MSNPFSNIISENFKQTYNYAIDALLEDTALTIPATFKYSSTFRDYCGNCTFDPIANKSSNEYNGTGPSPFQNNSICPVCGGFGYIDKDSKDTVRIAVIHDTRYWMGWKSKTVQIPDGSVQTICKYELINKIKNCNYVYFNNDDTNLYTLSGEPEIAGLSSKDYLICIWQRQQ